MILSFLGWFVGCVFFLIWFFQYLTTFGYECFTSQTERIGMSFCAALLHVGAMLGLVGIFLVVF